MKNEKKMKMDGEKKRWKETWNAKWNFESDRNKPDEI